MPVGVKKLFAIVALAALGLVSTASSAANTAADEAKRIAEIKVYEDNQFGMNIRGVWYWLSKDKYLVAIDTGRAAYNLKDIESLELVAGRGGRNTLVIQLRNGESIKAAEASANWIACRNVEVGQAACSKGGRKTSMQYEDRQNDLDLVFSKAQERDLGKIDIYRDAISNASNARPSLSVSGGPVRILIDEEWRAVRQRIDDYATRLAAAKVTARQEELAAREIAKREAPEREARYRRELQQEQGYWQAPQPGSKMFCETSNAIGANPGMITVSLGSSDKVACKGHEGREVRMGMLEAAGWKIVEQGSRPSGQSEFLVIAQIIMQKMR